MGSGNFPNLVFRIIGHIAGNQGMEADRPRSVLANRCDAHSAWHRVILIEAEGDVYGIVHGIILFVCFPSFSPLPSVPIVKEMQFFGYAPDNLSEYAEYTRMALTQPYCKGNHRRGNSFGQIVVGIL